MNNADSGRIALITGATAGIGLAILEGLVGQGARVVANSRGRERLEELARRLNDGDAERVVPVCGDAAELPVIDLMFATCRQRFGANPDIVVVNAGRGLPGSILNSDEAQWQELFRINCLGAFLQMRVGGQAMLQEVRATSRPPRQRDIVVIGSSIGRHVSPFNSVYGATKAALGSAVEALRRELSGHLIRVTLIEPGIVRSEFQQRSGYDLDWFEKNASEIGPILEPEDIARLVCFIVSQPSHVHINDVLIHPTRQSYP